MHKSRLQIGPPEHHVTGSNSYRPWLEYTALKETVTLQPEVTPGRPAVQYSDQCVAPFCCRLLSGEGTEQGWQVLKLVAVLYLAVLLGCTALINFSLGFILALTLVPVAAFVTPHLPK